LGLISLGITLVILSIVGAPISAQGNTAVVRPDPLELAVGEGQVETLNIVLENAQDVYGIDIRARFDPSIIEVVDSDPASDDIQMIPGSFPQPDFLVRNTADNLAGTLQYVTTQMNPTLPVNGSGIVFSLQVRGKVLGQSAVFSIEFVEIADRRGNLLPVTAQSSTVTVVSPKPPTVTPTPPPTPTSAPATLAALEPTKAPTALMFTTKASTTRTATPAAPGGLGNEPPSDTVLILIALAGFAGALALLAVAAIVLVRRRQQPQ
jgi:hypothetical protein